VKWISKDPPQYLFLAECENDTWERETDHEIFEINLEEQCFFSPRTGEKVPFKKKRQVYQEGRRVL